MRGLVCAVMVLTLAALFTVPSAQADCHRPSPPDCWFLEDDEVNKLYAQAQEALGKGTLDIHIGVHRGQAGTMDTDIPSLNPGGGGVIQYSIDFASDDTTHGADHPVEFEVLEPAAVSDVTPNPLVFTFSASDGLPQQWYHTFNASHVDVDGTFSIPYRLTAFKGTPDEDVVEGRLEIKIVDLPDKPSDDCRGNVLDCGDETPLPLWAPVAALGLVAVLRRR